MDDQDKDTMNIEAMKLALEALESRCGTNADERLPGGAITALRAALSQQPSTPEPVEDGIRNAEDELNCAEEVLDAITCEFSDGEFPGTGFNCIGDYITAVVDVFKERLAAQQPATPEPVKATPYNPTEEMRWAMKRIDPALSSEQCRALWSAAWSAAPSTHPAPSVPDDVARNAERWRHAIADGENQSMNFLDIFDDWDGDGDFVEVFDAAMLAAK